MFAWFRVTEFTSLLVTFGVTVIIESLIQWYWTADFRRYETPYATPSFRLGPLFVPALELLACLTAAALALGHLGVAALHLRRQGAARQRRGSGHRGGLRREPPARRPSCCRACAAAYAGVAGAFIALISTLAPSQIWAWLGVVFAVVIIGGLANPIGALLRRPAHRRQRIGHHGGRGAGLGAARVVLGADRASWSLRPGRRVSAPARRVAVGLVAAGLALRALPALGLPAFYESFLYLVFFWVVAGHELELPERLRRLLQLRPRRVLRRRHVHDGDAHHRVRRAVPARRCPSPARWRRCWRWASAPWSFASRGCAASCSALLTLAVTFVLATIVLNTRIDGGPGVYLSARAAAPAPAVADRHDLPAGPRRWRSPGRRPPMPSPTRGSGLGLFAIHDDEDVAEVKGVPTFRYKLLAFALSAGDRRRGRRHPRRCT